MVERPEDLNLPNAVIGRIIKDTLPDGVALSKEARSAISKAASVFVLYATSTSISITQKNKKKTLGAQDVLNAMKEMEFDKFVEPLQQSLEVHKKSLQAKKEIKEAKKAKKAEEEAVDPINAANDSMKDLTDSNKENGASSPAD